MLSEQIFLIKESLMNRDTFVRLFDYCRWANHRVWECVMALSDEQFEQPLEYSIGSIHKQVFHTMQVEHWWPHFLRTGELDFYPCHPEADRETIRAHWDQVEAKNAAYVAQLDEAELARMVRPDDDWEDPTWTAISVSQALYQVLFHSMDHRSQILAGLYKVGGPTVEQDFLYYLQDPVIREKSKQTNL
jgi:uncharacterized damage-inducible protein DinB